MRLPLIAAALIACSSCNAIEQPSGLIPRWTVQWREVVTAGDRERLANWRTAFVAALDGARKAGHAAAISGEGPLLEPDSALASPALPAGMYRCRVIKLGAKREGNLAFVAYPYFRCQVRADRGLLRLDKLTGSQRYVGLVFPGDAVRQVFLGTLVLGDESRALQYGQDEARNIAGYVERIGPGRWRLLMPEPHYESRIDVMELVPA